VTDEQRARLEALRNVQAMFGKPEDPPDPAELIALAEWVADGSISTATALTGQRAALYGRVVREDET
jgi:hypothetical protein